jgi:hypothetical protein
VLWILAALVLSLPSPRRATAQAVPPPPPRPEAPGSPPPAAAPAQPAAPAAEAPPGSPAPPAVVAEIRAAIAHAVERFEARDTEGVLAHVSDEYWTGPLGKRAIRAQLLTILQIHQQVRARVRLDDVRMVGEHAWVWTTGSMSGQLALVGQWMQLFVWERELEIARREQGVWRLYGYQQ